MPYVQPAADQPNVDSAGGKLVMALTGGPGPDTHKIGVHIQPIAAAATVSGSDVNWAYSAAPSNILGITWGGSESTIVDTFNALGALIMDGYDDTWSLTVSNLYTKSAVSGRLLQVFPTPNPAALPGSSSSLHVGANAGPRVSASIYFANTPLGGRFRLILPAFADREPQVRILGISGTGNPPGDALDEALVAYLQGGVTRILAHDGAQPHAPWRRNVTAMAKLRRVYSRP